MLNKLIMLKEGDLSRKKKISSLFLLKFKIARYIFNKGFLNSFPSLKLLLEKYLISISGLFDHSYYIQNNTDLNNEYINNLSYFINYGWKEYRNPNIWFDVKSYLSNFPEVRKIGINPLVDFIINDCNSLRLS
jgi:hypothetical protein